MVWVAVLGRLYGVAGVGTTAFGIVSWQDNAHAWLEWAEINPFLAGILTGAGGVMVVTYLAWEGFNNRRQIRPLEEWEVYGETDDVPDDSVRGALGMGHLPHAIRNKQTGEIRRL